MSWVVHNKSARFDVYIGRPSEWGNPYSHKEGTTAEFKVATRAEAIARYSTWLHSQPALVARAKAELKGKVLGCWCAPLSCHGDVLAELVNGKPRAVKPVSTGTELICIDTEYDARYSDRGVSRLACMTYAKRDGESGLLGYRDAVEQWVEWARDPSISFMTHAGWHDFGVLADEAHLHFEGELPEAPGFGPYWELAHRLYDDGRVVDTETRQRFTHIRFGPHKANVQLGALAQMYLGIDASAEKKIPEEARELLRQALPYEDWPADLLARTPWRVKFGMLREQHGNDVSAYPERARSYALEDARLPWELYDLQKRRWQRPIPNLHEQTAAAWMLHMVSIPGWLADRERAKSIRVFYERTIANCERHLLDAGVLVQDGPRDVQKQDALKGLVYGVLREETPVSKTLKTKLKEEQRDPTPDEQRDFASADARACVTAIKIAGGPDLGKTPKRAAQATERALVDVKDTLASLTQPSAWRTLYAHALRARLSASASEDARAKWIVDAAHAVLVEEGVLEIVDKRVVKEKAVKARVYAILGDDAPLTDKGYELHGYSPAPVDRLAFCSKDAKAIRAAILKKRATPLEIADAVEQSSVGTEAFDAWLEASGEDVLNALAVRSKADKTIVNFIDKLDTDRRIRTTYQTLVDTGRTSARGSGGAGTLNAQQLPRDYDKPKHLHSRGCIVVDPGWCFIVSDFSQIELCSLAYILTKLVRQYAKRPKAKATAERILGFEISTSYVSTLAQAINNDQDCHVRMAAVLRSSTYDECIGLYRIADGKKERGEKLSAVEMQIVADRQLSKPCNFGFPGGLGAASFVDYAAGYGVAITHEIAAKAHAAYMLAWPEMKLYFWHIKQTIKRYEDKAGYCGAGGLCIQIGSKRERGDCTFTQWTNGLFQGLASDGAKEAGRRLVHASYRDRASPMFGTRPSGFIHDEYLVNSRVEQAKQALPEVERHMQEGMEQWIPGVKIKAPGKILYERWGK